MNPKELQQAIYEAEDAKIDVSNLRKAEYMAYATVDMSIAKDLPATKAKLAVANRAVRKAEAVAKEKKRAVGKAKLAAYKHEQK